jgi:hypothetical protein
MTEISVMGNCNAMSLAACISAWLPDAIVHHRTLGTFENSTKDENLNYVNNLPECDVVFLQHPFPSNMLLHDFDIFDSRVIRFPNVAYTAFHPDSTYVKQGGSFITGATGPYHSALTLAGFLEDIHPDRLIKLFNRFTFLSLGYFDQHQIATDILYQNFREIGYDPAPIMASGVFMHTMNHPKIVAMREVAKQALLKSVMAPLNMNILPTDPLKRDWIWPVYADLPFGKDYIFHRGVGGHNNPVTLVDREFSLKVFIEKSFNAYANIDFDSELPVTVQRSRSFLQSNFINKSCKL